MKHLIAYGFPGVIAALAIPMILGRVPPNSLYGFRTSKTLSSQEIWYASNRVCGWLLFAAAVLTILVNLLVWWNWQDWEQKRQVLWMGNTMTVFLIGAVVGSLLYLRKL